MKLRIEIDLDEYGLTPDADVETVIDALRGLICDLKIRTSLPAERSMAVRNVGGDCVGKWEVSR